MSRSEIKRKVQNAGSKTLATRMVGRANVEAKLKATSISAILVIRRVTHPHYSQPCAIFGAGVYPSKTRCVRRTRRHNVLALSHNLRALPWPEA